MVKTASARGRMAVAAMVVASASAACWGTPDPRPSEKNVAPLQPGAQRWEGSALALPAGSPVVFTLEPGELVRGADALYEWIVSEPAMLGADGDQKARALVNVRETFKGELDMDLLSEADWGALGADVAKPVHVGLYPLSEKGRGLVRALDATAREHLGAGADDSLPTALSRWEEEGSKPGLHRALAATLREGEPERSGARVVMTIADEAQLLSTIDRAATRFKWRTAYSASGQPLRRVFYEDEMGWVATATVVGDLLTIDLFGALESDGLGQGATTEAIRAVAAGAIAYVRPGYPSAPRAPGAPALSVSLDQRGVTDWLNHAGMSRALARAQQAPASERDAQLARELRVMARGLKHWDVGADRLTGLTYGMHIGGEGASGARLVGGEMTLFGERALELPKQPGAPVSLDVSDRALGASVTSGFLFGEDWREWIGVDDPSNLLEIGENEGPAANASFIGSLPRNLALFISNFESALADEIALDSVPLHGQRNRIERIEFATTGLSLSGFLLQPQYVALITIKPEVEPIDRDAVSASLRTTMAAIAEAQSNSVDANDPDASAPAGEGDVETEEDGDTKAATSILSKVGPLEPGAITRLDPADMPAVSYYYERDGDAPFILIGNNLSDEELAREVELARTRPTNENMARSVYLRAEPVGLVELWSTYRPNSNDAIDYNVLAQRVGPIVLSVDASAREGDEALRYSLELLRPPSLD